MDRHLNSATRLPLRQESFKILFPLQFMRILQNLPFPPIGVYTGLACTQQACSPDIRHASSEGRPQWIADDKWTCHSLGHAGWRYCKNFVTISDFFPTNRIFRFSIRTLLFHDALFAMRNLHITLPCTASINNRNAVTNTRSYGNNLHTESQRAHFHGNLPTKR